MWGSSRGGGYLLAAPPDAWPAAAVAPKGLLPSGHVTKKTGGGGGGRGRWVSAGSEGLSRRLPLGGAVTAGASGLLYVKQDTATQSQVQIKDLCCGSTCEHRGNVGLFRFGRPSTPCHRCCCKCQDDECSTKVSVAAAPLGIARHIHAVVLRLLY